MQGVHDVDFRTVEWKSVLSAVVANATLETSDVLIALGDRLWIDYSNVLAAHVCYTLAQVPIEASSTLLGSCSWAATIKVARSDA